MSDTALATLFVQLAVMLAAGLVGGTLLRRWHLPLILGELLAGIVLGPTVFGALAPAAYGLLFPDVALVNGARDGLLKLGMLFFLFVAGLEVDLSTLGRRLAVVFWTSLNGILLPFALGAGAVILLPTLWGAGAPALPFALLIGTALSISALPVIARILMDLDLLHTELGMMVMASAMINDLVGWSLFAALLGDAVPGAPGRSLGVTLLLVAGLVGLVLAVGRPLATRALPWLRAHLAWPSGYIAATTVIALLVGAAAEAIGIHAFLGAFLVGLALAQNSPEQAQARETVRQFVVSFFAPIYFVSIGLRTNFIANFDLGLVLVVLAVACVGKVGGASLGAWLGRLPPREALAVGFGMNARGAMEMILASLALEYRLIDGRVFVALVLMALGTSLLSGPVMQRLLRGVPVHRPDLAATPAERV